MVLQEKRRRDHVKEEMESIEQDRLEHEIEYESIVQTLEMAKCIYKCKSTPDSVSKIFHGQAVEINNARLPGNKGDKGECSEFSHWPSHLFYHLVSTVKIL